MFWSVEEMESYGKLCKSLASKSRGKKSSSSMAAASPGPIAPVSVTFDDVDDGISNQFSVLSREFDKKLESLTDGILGKFNELVSKVEDRLSNRSFSAEPGVLGRTPVHGQGASLYRLISIDGYHRQFQVEGEDPVPLGSGFAHPSTFGESTARDIGVGLEPAQVQAPSLGGSEVVQPPGGLRRPRVSFAASTGPDLVAPEPEEEEERRP